MGGADHGAEWAAPSVTAPVHVLAADVLLHLLFPAQDSGTVRTVKRRLRRACGTDRLMRSIHLILTISDVTFHRLCL